LRWLLHRTVDYLSVRRLAGGRFDRFDFSTAPSDYLGGHRETHSPIGVQPVINKD
jgi:hypothetical protein